MVYDLPSFYLYLLHKGPKEIDSLLFLCYGQVRVIHSLFYVQMSRVII